LSSFTMKRNMPGHSVHLKKTYEDLQILEAIDYEQVGYFVVI